MLKSIFCCCRSKSDNTSSDLPSPTTLNGIHNNCYETWEPVEQVMLIF